MAHRHRTKDWPETVWHCPICTWRYLSAMLHHYTKRPTHTHRFGLMTMECDDKRCVQVERMRAKLREARRKLAVKEQRLTDEIYNWRSD